MALGLFLFYRNAEACFAADNQQPTATCRLARTRTALQNDGWGR